MRRVILGVDPGFTATGYSILQIEQGKTTLIACGTLSLPASDAMGARLERFYLFF